MWSYKNYIWKHICAEFIILESEIKPKGLDISVTLMSVNCMGMWHKDFLNNSNRGHNFVDSFVVCTDQYPAEVVKMQAGFNWPLKQKCFYTALSH